MSIMRTEFLLQRLRQGEVYVAHGPYDTLEQAEKQKAIAEKTRDENGPGIAWWLDTYRVMERDVTEWMPVMTHAPDWPIDD